MLYLNFDIDIVKNYGFERRKTVLLKVPPFCCKLIKKLRKPIKGNLTQINLSTSSIYLLYKSNVAEHR